MEKKQSSIEFAIEKITQFMTEENDFELGLIAEKLKAMHKEEIEDAWLNGMKGEMIAPFGMNRYKPEAEEYYNETFGNE